VDGIKAILEGGEAVRLFNRLDVGLLQALTEESQVQNLPIVVHTGDSRDIKDALQYGITGIEHGSFRDEIPANLFTQMAEAGVAYDPTLSVAEAFEQLLLGKEDLLQRSLVQQVGPPKLLQETRQVLVPNAGRRS
jgi:imidazolonepropionase-like amidohydrolase